MITGAVAEPPAADFTTASLSLSSLRKNFWPMCAVCSLLHCTVLQLHQTGRKLQESIYRRLDAPKCLYCHRLMLSFPHPIMTQDLSSWLFGQMYFSNTLLVPEGNVDRSVGLSSMSTPPPIYNIFRISMKVKLFLLLDCSIGTRVHLAQSCDLCLI